MTREVAFFQTLDESEKARFREEVQLFLNEKRITGINTAVNDTVRVLVAASAIIPIFGFPGWEWDQISEVLIYPTNFDESTVRLVPIIVNGLSLPGSLTDGKDTLRGGPHA